MRNMSFSKTTAQIRARTKTVTRRLGWGDLKPEDMVCAVEKGQGLKKGEKVKRIAPLRIEGLRPESLLKILEEPDYGRREMILEGFPGRDPVDFVEMFLEMNEFDYTEKKINRIQFSYPAAEPVYV